ncbi:MAG: dTDP-4-dehydrorhamnose 3,5-epimerase [Alphaproteobacteria bacterium]|nr:dTDP-4-dehydrorhamnose 3,5-epimerase [Alphaproteobacteria bacterium]
MSEIKNNTSEVKILNPRLFKDHRGYFFEIYNKKNLEKEGISSDFIQDNQSLSKYGTVRGLHFQKGQYAQSKLLRVVVGRILDIAVDIRSGSPTFGQVIYNELSEENFKQVFVPRGFAHGFSVLSDYAIVEYKCDNYYHKESECSILCDDEDLDINWMVEKKDILISDKDKLGITFKEYQKEPCF